MRDPDLTGPGATAWRIVPPQSPVRPDHEATIRFWLVNGPFHPYWSWWQIAVIHLRDIPGVPPARKSYSEAEYEFMIVSLNPERGTPDVDLIEAGKNWGNEAEAKFLTPPDAVVQFDGVTDDQAAAICDDAIRVIISGKASPDSDFRAFWDECIPATVDHYRAGMHNPDEGITR